MKCTDKTKRQQSHDRAAAVKFARKQTLDAFQISELRYRRLFEAAQDGILILDAKTGIITDVNPYLQKMLGFSRAEFLEKKLWEIGAFKDVEASKADFRALQRNKHFRYEDLQLKAKNGRLVQVEFVSNVYLVGNAKVIQCNIRDLTERKRAEAEIQRRTEQFAFLYDAGLALNRTLNPREQLEFLSKTAMQALRADNAGFFRYDAARGELRYEFGVGRGVDLEALHDRRFSLGEERGLVGWVAQIRAPFYLSDVSTDPRWIAVDPEIRSALWVPLEHEQELRGVLAVTSLRVNAFAPQDQQLLVLFANQISIAMENARLFEETKRHAKELEALAQISSALRTAPTRAEMLPVILDQLLIMLHADGAALAMRDLTSGDTVIEHARGDFIKGLRRLASGEGVSGVVIATGKPFVTNDVRKEMGFAQPDAFETVRAVACVPLVVEDQVIGALWVGRQSEISVAEVRLLTAIADIAANAIHRETLREQTDRRLRHLTALSEIDRAITSSFDLRVSLTMLLNHVTTQLGVDAAEVLLFNSSLQTLEHAVGHGFRTQAIERTQLHIGEDLAGRVALERHIIHISNLAVRDETPRLARALVGEDFVSYYGVPLIAKGQIKGVLEIFHRALLEPDEEWLTFLISLAEQAAIAIDNATLFDRLGRSNIELSLAYDTTLEGWSRALDLRDKETEGHTQRVTEITLQLARAMDMSDEQLVHVRRGGLLHDIGKMGIPDSILLKPGALTDEEWEAMRRHPQYAYEMLLPIPYLKPALDIPYCHHEKWDGSGYPRGLKGEQIPLAARVFAIVDVWDALRSDRPYRHAWSAEKTREHVQSLSGKHFDPAVVQRFLRVIASG